MMIENIQNTDGESIVHKTLLERLREADPKDISRRPVSGQEEFQTEIKKLNLILENLKNEHWLNILKDPADEFGIVQFSDKACMLSTIYTRIGEGKWAESLEEITDLIIKISYAYVIKLLIAAFNNHTIAESTRLVTHQLSKISGNANYTCSKTFEDIMLRSMDIIKQVRDSDIGVDSEMLEETDFNKIETEKLLRSRSKIIDFLEGISNDPRLNDDQNENFRLLYEKIDKLKTYIQS